MNEAETRAEYIDPALKAAGWGIMDGTRIRREFPICPGRIEGRGKRGKSLTADYVLEYRSKKLAVVEAKAWNEELTEGVGQVKNYADKLALRHAYATNGQGIWGIDMQTGKEGQLTAYPTTDELWAMMFPQTHLTDTATERAIRELEERWREILNYFSPAVYVYSLKDSINRGFLTPFRVKQIQTPLDVSITYTRKKR